MSDFLNDLDSLEILRIKPDWSSDISGEFGLSMQVFRFPGTAELLNLFSEERPGKYGMQFRNLEKADEYEILDFLMSRRGRLEKFWLPSPASFFTLDVVAASGQDEIIITKNRYSAFFRGYERIYIELKNGDVLTWKVVSIEDGPGEEQETITVSTNLDRTINTEDVLIFSLLHLVRFDKDVFDFSFYSDSVSDMKTEALELVKEYS